MKRLAVALLASLLAAAPLPAAPPDAPGPEIDATADTGAWHDLFARLAPQGPVFSRFTEERLFPFRSRPTVLHGEMRFDPAHGLSLRYLDPERILIIDSAGLLQRDDRGRTRALPDDARAVALNRALFSVLRFDPAEIARSFVVHGARDGDDWRLDLDPRDEALARMLGTLIVSGRGDELTRLEFRRSAKQRVTITIDEAQRDATFTAEDLKHFFR